MQVLSSDRAATSVNYLQRHCQLQRNPEEAPRPCVRHERCVQRRTGRLHCGCCYGDTAIVSKKKF